MKIKNINNILIELGNGLIEILFPPRTLCPACFQEESLRQGLGKNCLSQIALIIPPICDKCGRLLRLNPNTGRFCDQCRESHYYFSKARAVALYDGALREYLTELKYRYRPDLGAALGELLVEWIKAHPEYQKVDLIIPIPLHTQKLNVRGYNQAELLANSLQKHFGIKLKNDIIIRQKLTESQNTLGKKERFANIHEAFRVIDTTGLANSRVLLVDDIMTTGATVSEAARVLLRAGAREVKVLTLAAGVMDTQWFRDTK